MKKIRLPLVISPLLSAIIFVLLQAPQTQLKPSNPTSSILLLLLKKWSFHQYELHKQLPRRDEILRLSPHGLSRKCRYIQLMSCCAMFRELKYNHEVLLAPNQTLAFAEAPFHKYW